MKPVSKTFTITDVHNRDLNEILKMAQNAAADMLGYEEVSSPIVNLDHISIELQGWYAREVMPVRHYEFTLTYSEYETSKSGSKKSETTTAFRIGSDIVVKGD